MGKPFSKFTQQDTIDNSALMAITNKDGVTRSITWGNLKADIEAGVLQSIINDGPSSSVGTIEISNDDYSIASNINNKLALNFANLPNLNINSIRLVKSKEDLAGALRSDVLYIIDGVIDMGAQSISVPAGGLNISGWSFDVSGLTSSATNYTMFTSPVGGSGNLLARDVFITVTGSSASVYGLTSATGAEAFEIQTINYNNCNSLGYLDGYRQGFESETGRFGGYPELELRGTWLGGYRATTSIVRGMPSDFNGYLFKAGAGLSMSSRFLTDINADLGTAAGLFDFAESNFVNASTIQVQGAIITRNGAIDPNDTTVSPNISAASIKSKWRDNVGIGNTYEGGSLSITAEAANTSITQNQFYDVASTFTASDLQHFTSPSNGQLRHDGFDPRNYKLNLFFTVGGSSGDVFTLKVVKWDDSASGFVDVVTQTKPVNNLVGSDDIAFFNVVKGLELDANDYVKIQLANTTSTNNFTVKLESFFELSER